MFSVGRINLDAPRYDQSTFEGRAKHFFITTNPLNVLASDEELDRAKTIVDAYRAGKEDKSWTEDQIWAAKQLYDSAFHPQTGEKLFILGRMSCQVPGNMLITGCMMTFYKSTPAVIFWQTINQTFNAVVNYTNRNATAPVSNEQLGTAYVAATSASVTTALIFNKIVNASPALSGGIIGRLVPLVAVAAANCVNIPLMRQQVKTFVTKNCYCLLKLIVFIITLFRKLKPVLLWNTLMEPKWANLPMPPSPPSVKSSLRVWAWPFRACLSPH
jgi:tricarboxylate carrier